LKLFVIPSEARNLALAFSAVSPTQGEIPCFALNDVSKQRKIPPSGHYLLLDAGGGLDRHFQPQGGDIGVVSTMYDDSPAA